MAADLDGPPIFDPLTKGQDYINNPWLLWLTALIQNLTEYLSHYGIFIPQITTEERDKIQNPVPGQMIYNTTLLKPQIWIIDSGGIALWRTFTTTP